MNKYQELEEKVVEMQKEIERLKKEDKENTLPYDYKKDLANTLKLVSDNIVDKSIIKTSKEIMNYLVKFGDDYADEFNVCGFCIVSKDVFDFQMRIVELFWKENPGCTKEFYFGTNEFMEYSSYQDIQETLTVTEISDEEILTFKKFFGEDYTDQIDFGVNQLLDFSDFFCDDIENLSPEAVKELNVLMAKAYPDEDDIIPYVSTKV
jgi:hypothetical protein